MPRFSLSDIFLVKQITRDVTSKEATNRNYFEIIFDKSGLNLIPKNILSIDVESDREDINRIKT